MPRQKKPKTARDFLSELETDFGFQAAAAMRREAQHDEAERRKLEQAELIADLEKVGVSISEISDLLSVSAVSPGGYAVLLDHITRDYRPWLLEWIGRSFGRKDAYCLFEELVVLLKNGSLPSAAATGVAAAISDIARPSDLDTIIALASDTALGKCRIFFVRNLTRSRKPHARASLQALNGDSDIGSEIRSRLSRAKR